MVDRKYWHEHLWSITIFRKKIYFVIIISNCIIIALQYLPLYF